MESFNFGAFDTNLGARIAAIPQEAQKQQSANMLQAMQMQGAMNQNELARYSLASAQRTDASQNAVNAALKGSIVDGKINYDLLTSNLAGGAGASKIPDFLKARSEEEKRTQDIEKTKGDIAKQAREAVDSELTFFTKNAFKVTDVPSLTTHLRAFYDNPLLGKIAARFKTFDQALNDDIKQISTPEGLRQWQAENANLTGKELTDLLLKVTTTTENLNDVSRTTQRGGMGQTIGVPVDTPMGMTPGQVRAAADAKLSREQSERHFNNPNLSIQQTPTGFVAFNSRTGTATPVVYGSQATPGISMPRQPQPVTSETSPIGTPGTPVMGSQSGLKPIPANINLAILSNNSSIKNIDETIKSIKANPDAIGVRGYLPGAILNRADPEGIEARAGVADIGSIILHDRSGAAVTASESPRLMPFIPLPTDNKETAIRKLTRLRNIVEQDQTGLTETYGKDQGYLPNPTVGKTDAIKPNAPSPSAPPIQSFRRPD